MRDGIELLAESWRASRTANTVGAPAAQRRNISGMSSGGSCRSAEMTAAQSPEHAASPAKMAGTWPKFRAEIHDADAVGHLLVQQLDDLERTVGRPVVDEDQFVSELGRIRVETPADLDNVFAKRLRLAVNRHHDRQFRHHRLPLFNDACGDADSRAVLRDVANHDRSGANNGSGAADTPSMRTAPAPM